jgi:hypothetical protein
LGLANFGKWLFSFGKGAAKEAEVATKDVFKEAAEKAINITPEVTSLVPRPHAQIAPRTNPNTSIDVFHPKPTPLEGPFYTSHGPNGFVTPRRRTDLEYPITVSGGNTVIKPYQPRPRVESNKSVGKGNNPQTKSIKNDKDFKKWVPTIVGGVVLGGGLVSYLDGRKHGRTNNELYRS